MMIGKKSSPETVLVTHETNIKDFISTFLITLSNPITMIAFVAALSNINYLFQEINFIHSSILVLGIFSVFQSSVNTYYGYCPDRQCH